MIPLTHGKKVDGSMYYYESDQVIFWIENNRKIPIRFKNAGFYLFDIYGNISACKFNTVYAEDYEVSYICNPGTLIKISCYAPRSIYIGEPTVIGGFIKLQNGETFGFNFNPFLRGIITRSIIKFHIASGINNLLKNTETRTKPLGEEPENIFK